jgi:hypothetical protein
MTTTTLPPRVQEHVLMVDGKRYTVKIREAYTNDEGRAFAEKTTIAVHRVFPSPSPGYNNVVHSQLSVRTDTRIGKNVLAKLQAKLEKEASAGAQG